MAKQNDIFNKGFDEGTQIKLYILRKYLQEWLPVFLVKGTSSGKIFPLRYVCRRRKRFGRS